MTTVRLLIEGRVQGVGFRYFLQSEAQARCLSSWVRNRRSGAVEALVSGEPASADEVIAACRRGPPASQVTGIDVSDSETAPQNEGFIILPTV